VNTRLLIMLAGGASAAWAFSNWRKAVQVTMVLVIFEGALRKWFFPSSQDLVYFAKDVLLLGAYLGFFRDRTRLRFRPPAIPLVNVLLAASALVGLLQVFNPNLPNLLVGIFGFKAYFFYVPLLWLLPAAFRSDTELWTFLRRYVLITIPVGLLAVAQFFSPSSSVLNTYARTTGPIGTVITFGSSEYVRVTATFSFITGYTAYLLATAMLLLGVLGALRWRFRGNLYFFLALVMDLLGMLMTGSRGPVFLLVAVFPLYWWLAVIRERGGGAAFGRLVVAMVLVAGFLSFAGEDALNAFYGRALGRADVPSRIASPLLSPFALLPEVGLVGYGIGATHQTAVTLAPHVIPYSWLRGLLVEVESGRVMIELGPVGFGLVYLLRIVLSIVALRQVLLLRTRFHRALVIASLLFFLTSIPGGVVFDVTADLYYWFFAGLLLTAMRLDRLAAQGAGGASRAHAPHPEPALPAVAILTRGTP
jgi:hypothetical protein